MCNISFDIFNINNKIQKIMYPKFVLLENFSLDIGMCQYHAQLVKNHKCLGGGWYMRKNNDLILYLNSEQYGAVSVEDINNVKDILFNRRKISQSDIEHIYFAQIPPSVTFDANLHMDTLKLIYKK